MANMNFGAGPAQVEGGPNIQATNDFGFGNSNWNTGGDQPTDTSQFNATSGPDQPEEKVDEPQQDAFGFDQPAQAEAPAQDAFGFGGSDAPAQDGFGLDQPPKVGEPAQEAFGFDEPPKGDQIANIGEDAEELALIEASKQAMQQRLAQLRQKEDEELAQKRALKQKAQEELNEWYSKKNTAGEARRKQNKEEEWAFLQTREEHKKSKNPWEKIIDNVEIDPRKYLGTKDVTRMRQAMVSRKQDLKKSG